MSCAIMNTRQGRVEAFSADNLAALGLLAHPKAAGAEDASGLGSVGAGFAHRRVTIPRMRVLDVTDRAFVGWVQQVFYSIAHEQQLRR